VRGKGIKEVRKERKKGRKKKEKGGRETHAKLSGWEVPHSEGELLL